MPVRLHHIVIDAYDLPGLARFWTQALGWKILSEREREIVIGPDDNAPVGICFMPVSDPKTVKNRVHLDLTSSATERDQEIDRLLALGARRVDVGQSGNESPRLEHTGFAKAIIACGISHNGKHSCVRRLCNTLLIAVKYKERCVCPLKFIRGVPPYSAKTADDKMVM